MTLELNGEPKYQTIYRVSDLKFLALIVTLIAPADAKFHLNISNVERIFGWLKMFFYNINPQFFSLSQIPSETIIK